MRTPWTSARLALATAACTLIAAAPAAAEPLALEFRGVDAVDTGQGADGVIGAGDTVEITPSLESATISPLSGILGTMTAPGGDVTIQKAQSAFSDVTFGGITQSLEPLRFHIPTSWTCGRNVNLSLGLVSGSEATTIPFTVGTGMAGAPQEEESVDVPLVIPQTGTALESAIVIDHPGRIKDLRVRIGRITHSYVEDLRIELVHPDGTVVVLADRVGGDSDDFIDTTFALDGGLIEFADAPRTGVFRAQGDLNRLVGKPASGSWKLRILDLSPADTGALHEWGMDSATATCVAQPIASFTATPNPVLVGGTVTFDGSTSSDPVGTITSYNWDLDGDGTFETNTGTNPVVTKTYTEQATLAVKLRIDDDHGLSATQTRTLAVTTPPSAQFTVTPQTPETGQTVYLDGSTATDADGTVVRWQWDLDGNGTFERDTADVSVTTHTFSTPGEKTVRLKVTDDRGATNSLSKVVTVSNRAPVARFAAPEPAVTGQVATFDGSASEDPDGTVNLYSWDLDGDGSFETGPSPEPTASTTYALPGTVPVSLRVTDELGAEHVLEKVITVTAPPLPVLAASPLPARPNQQVTFNGSGSSDPDGAIVRYQWDLDGNGTYEHDTGATPTMGASFPAPVAFTARLRVTDNDGAVAVATLPFSVVNLMPTAILTAAPSPATAGQAVTLDASASTDSDGTIAKYEWDLDGVGGYELDGGSSPQTTRTFPNPAVITVRVRVTDAEGGQATASMPLTVLAPVTSGGTTSGGTTSGGTTSGGTTSGGTTSGGTTSGGTTSGGTTSGGTTSGGTTSGGTTTGGTARQLAATLSGKPIQKLKTVLKKGAPMACVTDRAATCTLQAEISVKEALRLKLLVKPKARIVNGKKVKPKKLKPIRLGRYVKASTGTAKGIAFKVTIPKKYRAKLGKAKTVSIVVRGTAKDAKGTTVGLSRALLLRR